MEKVVSKRAFIFPREWLGKGCCFSSALIFCFFWIKPKEIKPYLLLLFFRRT